MKKTLLLGLLFLLSSYLSAQNYTVLGNAANLSGCNCFQLTANANNQAGAIYQNQTINLNNSFDFTFSVFLGCNNGSGADGIMFVLTSNPNGLGNPGEGLGYAGPNQPFSLAVEFDTYQNGNVNDPGFAHIAINSGGQYNHNVAAPVPALTSQAPIDNCQQHTVRVVWDVNTGTFSVFFDGVLRIQITNPNLVNTYFGGNPVVNWGWSGATGGGTNQQNVCVQSTSNWVAGVNYQSCNLTIQFNDISTSNLGSVQSWAWNFGDGGTSTLQNPTHTYSSPGTYTVSLTITDLSGCTNTYTRTITINPPISLTPAITQPLCNGGATGSINLTPSGGFGPAAGYGGYQYTWNDGLIGPTRVGLVAGNYSVTVTDGVCTTTALYNVNQPTPLTASTSYTNASCATNNGTASITLSGGTTPYNPVVWVPGNLVGNTITGLAPGLYIADFTDANGCSALLQYSVTIQSLPCGVNASTSSTNVTCYGGNNGTATLTVTGGAPPATITWSNGASGATITGLTAGTYTYNYSDNNPANAFSGSITITQPGAAMVASLTTTNMSCTSSNDGQAVVSVVSGGLGGYSYNWSSGTPNGAIVTGLSPGAISVTVTDAGGCTATASGTISGPTPFNISITTVDDSCYQSGLGSATVNVSGSNPPYTYYWSNISTAQTNLSLTAGSYTVTVTDDKGCTITGSATINEPTQLITNITSTNVNCFGQNTGSINVNASGGTPGYNYTWNPSSATGSNPTNLAAGTYNLTVSDANNCTTTDTIVISQPATALSVTTSHTDVTCNGLNNGSVTITIGGGTQPYYYQGNLIPPGTNTLTSLAPGTYSGVISDGNGCTLNVSETVNEPGPQSLTFTTVDNTCNGGSSGSITANFVNATGNVNYVWSNGATGAAITNLIANTYTVTATDANLCSLTGNATITEPAAAVMNVTVVNPPCFGTNGSATANPSGGTGAYTYVWSTGGATTQTVNLPAGNYSVTAIDANGCNQTATLTITEPTDITIQETHTDVLCFGNNTGDITLNVSGGAGPNYTYNWNPNVSNTNTAALLTAGTYTITVTDQSNCNKSISVVIDQPSQALAINIQSNNITCFGQTNGSITITPSGGTPGYTYTWNPNVGSGNTATNLSAGTYNITITDLNNCTIAPNVVISEPNQPLTLTPTYTNLSCFQSNNGTASVAVTGGTFPYSYQWTGNVSTTNTATSLAAGNYTVTVTDNNGCTNTNTFQLTQPSLLTATEIHTDVLCFGDTTGTVTITANGGTPGYTYAWTSGVSNTNAATGLGAGNYTVLVTDTNNCTVSISATVAQPTLLTLNATATNVLCNGGSDGTITATSTGGTPAYTYSITQDGTNFVNEPNGLFTNLLPGNYTVIAADLNGCTTTQPITITEPLPLSVTTSVINASCYRFSDGVVTITAAGGVPGYTFNSDSAGNSINGTFTGLTAGNYSFTITDNNGCSVTETASITEPDSIIVTVSPSPTEVNLGSTLQINTTTNQSGNVTYSWTPNFGLSCYDCADPVFEGVYSQPYNLIVTNANGCTGSSQFLVTVIPNYDVFFPNAFTPNSDGANDEWQVYGNLTAIKQFNVKVFNRIGEKVFESNDVNYRWDGTYKGAAGVPGVYVYHATIVWLNNHTDAKYIGSVTLMR